MHVHEYDGDGESWVCALLLCLFCLFAVIEDLILGYGYDICLLSDLSAYFIPICRLCIIGYASWHGRDDQNELFFEIHGTLVLLPVTSPRQL